MADTRGGGQCMSEVSRGTSARALIKALRSDGFRLVRIRSSHQVNRHPDGRRVVVAYHHISDNFPVGTLKAMIQDIGWTEEDFRRHRLTAN